MKRIYKNAASVTLDEGWGVVLDGKPLRTPAKRPLVAPNLALAEAIAGEWQAQGETVDPNTMPMMRLSSIALDLVAPRRAEIIAELVNYAGTDLVCYRADHPAELIERQRNTWQPLADWATLRFDAPLAVTSGILPVPQAPTTLAAFAAALEPYDAMRLTALHAVTTACGSLVIGLALLEGRLDAEAAFTASQLDESYQIEKWGEDSEQAERRAALRADIAAASRFSALVSG
ncbi:MAG: ATPase [Alphaproteobacteria bacterium]|nr:ATPase [Alphaproteobacteria bacterium]